MNALRRLDLYTVIIALLIPFVMLTAWGASSTYESIQRGNWCDDSVTYLNDMRDIASQYENAGSLDNVSAWTNQLNSRPAPPIIRPVRDAVARAVTYASAVEPDLDTRTDGAVYDRLPFLQDDIDTARDKLADACSRAIPLLPGAFPMIFKDETP